MLSIIFCIKVLCFLSINITYLFSQTLDSLEREKGLFHYRLGGSKSSCEPLNCKGLVQLKRKCIPLGAPQYYQDVPIKQLVLYFYQEKLHSIELKLMGEEASQTFLMYLELKYGQGKQKGYSSHYEWRTSSVWLVYDENLLTHNAVVRWTYIPLQKKLEEDYLKMYRY